MLQQRPLHRLARLDRKVERIVAAVFVFDRAFDDWHVVGRVAHLHLHLGAVVGLERGAVVDLEFLRELRLDFEISELGVLPLNLEVLVLRSAHQRLVKHQMPLILLRRAREGILVPVKVTGHSKRLALDCLRVFMHGRVQGADKSHLV